MTTKGEWVRYTGSDEQITDMFTSRFILDCQGKQHDYIFSHNDFDTVEELNEYCTEIKLEKYWIIPDDPLREMKIRQAMTGQPVWVRECRNPGIKTRSFVYETHTPDWNIPNAEYSFTPFEE